MVGTEQGAGICLHDLASASVFASLVSSCITGIYCFSRLDFQDRHFSELMTCLCLSWFLTCSGSVWRLLIVTTGGRTKIPDAAIYLLTILLLCMLGMLEKFVSFDSASLIRAIGSISLAVTLLLWMKGGHPFSSFLLTTLGVPFGAWVGMVALGSGYQDPLFRETLLVGEPPVDTLFHVSVANMLRTYGIPGTGLDGIPYLHYHFGSHWLFGQIANLLNMDVLQFYNLGFPIIFIPFLLNSIVVFALTYRGALLTRSVSDGGLRSSLGFWGILVLAHLGVFPAKIHSGNSHLISESYALGLTAFFLFSAIAVHIWKTIKMDGETRSNFIIMPQFFMMALMLAIIGFLKSSLMILSFILATYLIIRSGVLSLGHRLLFLGINIPVLILVISMTISRDTPGLSLEAFHYLKNFVQQEWWPWFLFFELFWSWVFIFLRTKELGVTTLGSLRDTVVSRRALDVEVVVLVSLIGLLPGLMMAIPGGSAAYFSDFQKWLSVGLIMANLNQFWSVLWKTKMDKVNS